MDAKDAKRLIQAEGYLELDLPKEAWRILAGSSDRNGHEWLALAAECKRQLHEYAEALVFLERAVTERPEEISLYINMGWCLKRLDRLSEAIDALLAADKICRQLRLGDTHPLVMYNLSCYYSLAGDKQEMLSWLSAALDKEPGYCRLIPEESDFDSFRQDEAFLTLVAMFDKRT